MTVSPGAAIAPERYELGAPVSCADGDCGELSRVVVDPITRTVTDVVVGPRHRHARARLVPVGLVHLSDGKLRLDCALAVFRALRFAEATDFLPENITPLTLSGTRIGASLPGMLAWPYYGPVQRLAHHERIPLGEVEVRRGERVHAADGEVGRVEGLVVEPEDHQVTHVLLRRGHLWGARTVAIPAGSISRLDFDGVHTELSKRGIGDLPEIEVTLHAPGDAAA